MNFYNDVDAKACAWLNQLIRNEVIPNGVVSQKSIHEIQPADLDGFRQVHLFAGIGGWSEALRIAGWPNDEPVWTGSCPCQPFSSAGKRKGFSDERHLWPEFARLIRQCRPAIVFGEQVASRGGREWISRVRADLEGMGYAVGAADLCAAGEGSPHIRQRLFWGAVRTAHAGVPGLPERERERRVSIQKGSAPESQASITGSDACGMDDANGARFQPSGCRESEQPERRPGLSGVGCPIGGVDQSPVDGCQNRPQLHRQHDREVAVNGREPDGLGNSVSDGQQVPSERDVGSVGSELSTPLGSDADGPNFWSRYSVAHCRDGKARRFEPESFPLAHGVQGRVGLLRGYGNAIVPQVAARFIRAFVMSLTSVP